MVRQYPSNMPIRNHQMKFSLSNRQLKTLNTSRQPLLVYLPCPPDPPEDLVKWASARLPSVAAMIASADVDEAICQPTRDNSGSNSTFGSLRLDWTDDRPCYIVRVVIVLLKPQRPRGKAVGPMWAIPDMPSDHAEEGEQPETVS